MKFWHYQLSLPFNNPLKSSVAHFKRPHVKKQPTTPRSWQTSGTAQGHLEARAASLNRYWCSCLSFNFHLDFADAADEVVTTAAISLSIGALFALVLVVAAIAFLLISSKRSRIRPAFFEVLLRAAARRRPVLARQVDRVVLARRRRNKTNGRLHRPL